MNLFIREHTSRPFYCTSIICHSNFSFIIGQTADIPWSKIFDTRAHVKCMHAGGKQYVIYRLEYCCSNVYEYLNLYMLVFAERIDIFRDYVLVTGEKREREGKHWDL